MRVNRRMVPIKAAIFMYVGGVTGFLPYLTLHMREIGLDMEEIAVIYAVLPIASVFGPTLSGMIADKTGRYTGVLVFNVIFTALFHTSLILVPRRHSASVPFRCDSQGMSLQSSTCDNLDLKPFLHQGEINLQECELVCLSEGVDSQVCRMSSSGNFTRCHNDMIWDHLQIKMNFESNSTKELCTPKSIEVINGTNKVHDLMCTSNCTLSCTTQTRRPTAFRWQPTFHLYFILRILGTITLSSCFTMLDAVVLSKVKETGGDFGRQRLMSVLSQAIVPLCAGILVDYFNGDNDHIDYAPAFYLGDAMLACTVLILLNVDFKAEVNEENITKHLWKLITRVEVDIFLVMIILLGMNWGFLETFLFPYLTELKAPTYMLGLTLTVGCATGLPVMFWSDYIVAKVGRATIFLLSFLAYFIRLVGYSYIQSPWQCFPFEILEVITYQMMWVAAATYCPILAPPNLLATMTGIAGAAHYSVGRGLGSFLGGFLISLYGLRATFRGLGYAALGGAVFHLVTHKFILQKKIAQREHLSKLVAGSGENEYPGKGDGPRKASEAMFNSDIIAAMQNSSRRNSCAL